MQINRVALNNFRNYKLSAYDLSDGVNCLYGPNAVGKTSLIEAIHLLSTGDSFRSGKIDEMVNFDHEVARVSAKIIPLDKEDDETLEILLNRGLVGGRKTQKRLYTLNGAKKRKKDFVGKFFSVVFRPEDMRLIEGSKSRRRKFMDEALSVLDWQYARALKMYDEALLKRNRLLWQIKEGMAPRTTLKFWDMTLLGHGEFLQQQRQRFLESFTHHDFPLEFRTEYQPSIISKKRQEEYLSREVAAGHSLIGPHKDDFGVFLKVPKLTGKNVEANADEINIAIYGSRGQQRMAVLWLKICQLNFIEEKTGQKVLLLLDDILSELDEIMIEKVFSLLEDRQSIISSADKDSITEIRERFPASLFINLSEDFNNGTKF